MLPQENPPYAHRPGIGSRHMPSAEGFSPIFDNTLLVEQGSLAPLGCSGRGESLFSILVRQRKQIVDVAS